MVVGLFGRRGWGGNWEQVCGLFNGSREGHLPRGRGVEGRLLVGDVPEGPPVRRASQAKTLALGRPSEGSR